MGMPPDCIRSAINKMHLECSTMAVSNSNATVFCTYAITKLLTLELFVCKENSHSGSCTLLVKCLFVNKMNRLRKLLLWKQIPSVKGKFDTFNETCLMFIFIETIYSSG